MASEEEVRDRIEARKKAYAEFQELALQASSLLSRAVMVAILHGLHEIDRRRAEAAGALAGYSPGIVPTNPLPDHFLRARDDLEFIARKLDPLIQAVADNAAENCSYVARRHYDETGKDVIKGAIDGNLTWCLEQSAEALREAQAIADQEGDADREYKIRKGA